MFALTYSLLQLNKTVAKAKRKENKSNKEDVNGKA